MLDPKTLLYLLIASASTAPSSNDITQVGFHDVVHHVTPINFFTGPSSTSTTGSTTGSTTSTTGSSTTSTGSVSTTTGTTGNGRKLASVAVVVVVDMAADVSDHINVIFLLCVFVVWFVDLCVVVVAAAAVIQHAPESTLDNLFIRQ